jgi:putative hydrolase of the HAD superfamily
MENFLVNKLPSIDYQNVIFDLGGVIMKLDIARTVAIFNKMGISDLHLTVETTQLKSLYMDFEKGLISDSDFRKHIMEQSGVQITQQQFDMAWNAMLVEIPEDRIDLLVMLGTRYRTFMLSNTNAIHERYFTHYLEDKFDLPGFDALFEEQFLSHNLHMRKPDIEIFEEVCRQADLKPSETIFIDDVEANVKAAAQAGLWGIHLQAPCTIEDLFADTINNVIN